MTEITIAAYAKLHGCTPKTIRNAIDAGIIKRIGRGVIDKDQADRSWGSLRRVRVATDDDTNDTGRQSARAKIAGGIAKLRLIRHKFEHLQKRHLDRQPAVDDLLGDVEKLLVALRTFPAAEAAAVAGQLGIDEAIARDLLSEFLDQVLVELGDLAGEARAAAETA